SVVGVSVPSSSGRTLQPVRWRPPHTNQRQFQSPLRRGALFNHLLCHEPLAASIVSVPSSSGRILQPFLFPFERVGHHCLGPIFLPTVSSPTCLVYVCSSPLFFGAHSSPSPLSCDPSSSLRFSPLFVGAHSSTAPASPIISVDYKSYQQGDS